MVKQQLGQFYTSNSDYILQGFEKFVKNKEITDPFSGACDLLIWANKNKAKNINGFDIDPKNKQFNIKKNDSLLKPNKYNFVLTNPPYLNINKASKESKEKYFSKFPHEDLYQISLESILDSEEGIVIVPINFLCSRNAKKIRNKFLHKFKIEKINYFKQQVFEDTTYNVIAFYYKKRKKISEKDLVETVIYPECKKVLIPIERKNNWQIGGDFVSKINSYNNEIKIKRLLDRDIEEGNFEIDLAIAHTKKVKKVKVSENNISVFNNNIILLKSIDSGTDSGMICLEDIRKYNVKALVSKESSRNMIQLIFPNSVPVEMQEELIKLFNKEFNDARSRYLSLFLTNYRDKNRKRVGFDFVYKFLNYLLQEKIAINSENKAINFKGI